MTIVVVENGCEKRHFLVWNRVRIWRPCRHTPCKSFLEYPPGMIRTKLFLVWLNFRLTFKYYHRETEIRTVRFLTENLQGKTGLGRLSDCDRLCVLCTPGGGGVFLGIHARGVQSGFPNPDPISDQKMSFFTPVFRTRPLKSIPVFTPGL